MTERKGDRVRAYGAGCIGCRSEKMPIMLTCKRATDDEEGQEEYYLTTEQAEALAKELTERLIQNRRDD